MKLIQLINKYATGKATLFFFIAAQLVYGAMIAITIPHVLSFAQKMTLLDLMPMGYGSEYVQQLFETLGETGRHAYLWQQLPLDMIYPGLFAVAYALLVAYLLRVVSIAGKWQYLILVPIFAGAFDYLENIGTITMLNLYPTFHPWLATLTSVFTVLKSMTSLVVFVSVGSLFVWAAVKKLSEEGR